MTDIAFLYISLGNLYFSCKAGAAVKATAGWDILFENDTPLGGTVFFKWRRNGGGRGNHVE